MAVQIERMAMVLSAMRGTFALSREAGNELKPEYNSLPTGGPIISGVMDGESGECHSPEKEEKSRIGSGITEEENRLPDGTTDERIYCADEDYETAEMIGNKMLLHMAAAYRMIDGDAQEVVPEIKPLDQRKVLFEQLKITFERKELIQEAKTQGISERTAERWNDKWQEEGQVIKLEHGRYRKVG